MEDYQALYHYSLTDNLDYWKAQSKELHWFYEPHSVFEEHGPGEFVWFGGGRLNAAVNCVDRHAAVTPDKTAIIFEGEPGDTKHISYQQLHDDVCQFANALKARGIKKGDRVVIYMPMVPEAVIAMQACARIGAIHSVVFGGFSADSLRDRINDAQAVMLITADGGTRGGKIVELKEAADKALDKGCPSIKDVIVLKRSGQDIAMQDGRDIWWSDAVAGQDKSCEPEWVNAEDPLFLLYTSGSTGKPKGIQHSSAGYLLNALTTNLWVFDLQDSDVFWCTADVGWITGHTYVAYGPLATGSTIVMYEGGPMTPDAGRFWKICEDHRITVFYTAPTAIRAINAQGDSWLDGIDLSSLRVLGTVGEPINPEAWMWYHENIGASKLPVVDTWWQTETGGMELRASGARTTSSG